ncbi:serine/threonine-protein kinase [Lentzea jiangxiensis]|uniref:non-specific serine/threonine protein kinase n=1 Tax=Lentzea jiangxiensis TaxID=641025 RepID=A0A1H0JMJ0_9PSEU|nr:serine/threonine-protein kinase [Lentzea jiangxiensis]SDO44926.1 Serine/threonine protein kinase [Lentzea jiangxiensis]
MTSSAHDRMLADRYEIAELLGTGGVAEVRRARDTRLHRDVAVKLFRAGSELSHERRFANEVKTLAALSHPGLVRVHDAGTADGAPFVVLQLIDGPTLRERLTDGPLAVDDVRHLGTQLANALAYVHARDVVHRDIKPSNILLDRHGNAHLADFGLARLIGSTRLTRTDQVVGTAAYLAPEQVRGDEFGQAVDIYALGLVLLECLTGHREYEGSEIEAAVARLHRQPFIPEGLPPDLERLLMLMTSLSARRRPSAAECARVLRDPDRPITHVVPPARPRRTTRLLAASAAATVMAAAGVAFAVLSPSPPSESAPAQTTTAPPPASTTDAPAPTTDSPRTQTPAPVLVAEVSPHHEEPAKKPEHGKPAPPAKGKGHPGKG